MVVGGGGGETSSSQVVCLGDFHQYKSRGNMDIGTAVPVVPQEGKKYKNLLFSTMKAFVSSSEFRQSYSRTSIFSMEKSPKKNTTFKNLCWSICCLVKILCWQQFLIRFFLVCGKSKNVFNDIVSFRHLIANFKRTDCKF